MGGGLAGGVVGWWCGGRVMFPSRVHVGDDLGHPKFLMVLMTQYSILCYALKHFYKYIYISILSFLASGTLT